MRAATALLPAHRRPARRGATSDRVPRRPRPPGCALCGGARRPGQRRRRRAPRRDFRADPRVPPNFKVCLFHSPRPAAFSLGSAVSPSPSPLPPPPPPLVPLCSAVTAPASPLPPPFPAPLVLKPPEKEKLRIRYGKRRWPFFSLSLSLSLPLSLSALCTASALESSPVRATASRRLCLRFSATSQQRSEGLENDRSPFPPLFSFFTPVLHH